MMRAEFAGTEVVSLGREQMLGASRGEDLHDVVVVPVVFARLAKRHPDFTAHSHQDGGERLGKRCGRPPGRARRVRDSGESRDVHEACLREFVPLGVGRWRFHVREAFRLRFGFGGHCAKSPCWRLVVLCDYIARTQKVKLCSTFLVERLKFLT